MLWLILIAALAAFAYDFWVIGLLLIIVLVAVAILRADFVDSSTFRPRRKS